MELNTFLTVKDYAEWLGKSKGTIYNWIDIGKIPEANIKRVLSTILIKKILIKG